MTRTGNVVLAFAAAAAMAVVMAGCSSPAASGSDSGAPAGSQVVVKIPDPGNSGSLAAGKKDGSFEQALAKVGARVQWTGLAGAFAPAALALNAGELDMATGSITSAVMALGQSPKFELFARAEPDGLGEGILVKNDSGIKTVDDLKGRKVAVWHGSTSEYLLLKAIEQAGLSADDVERVYLQPAESAAVFHAGQVDAWATWSTFSVPERATQPVHFLVNGDDVGSQNSAVWTVRTEFADRHPQVVRAVYEWVHKTDLDRQKNPEKYVNVFRTSGPDAYTAKAKDIAIEESRAGHEIVPIDDSALKDFDDVATFYADRGITDGVVDVREHVIDVTGIGTDHD